MKDVGIVWFRSDLRLHDNESIYNAMNTAENIIPVYIFDTRVFKGKTSFGFEKTGKFRCQFVLQAVEDLRKNLIARGSNLLIRVGKPEIILPELVNEYNASWVFCNRERTHEEVKVQDAIESKLWGSGKEIIYSRGKMLYYTSDLPFPVSHTPDTFTAFRKEVEKLVKVRLPLETPNTICSKFNDIDWGNIPTLSDFGHHDFELKSNFTGGETYALKQLKEYIWEKNLLYKYKETRNELLGWDYSSKLSPWLSLGCISPKLIYHEVKKYEKEVVANDSTYWLIFELMWRDFFRLVGKKFGNKIFQRNGIRNKYVKASEDNFLFNKWVNGETGIPFIDANMRELKSTGFMSNRGRQNVASFLVHDLNINWIMGAEYFESILIDYDPCSNYGNWNYIAGIGNDPREDRYFNINTQVKKYDEKGKYIKHWLPELSEVPAEYINNPCQMNDGLKNRINFIPGKNYPKPIVRLKP